MSRLAGTATAQRIADVKSGKAKIGSRGKAGEASVREVLKSFAATHPHFDWIRLPDARTAGGHIGRQTGDFLFFMPGGHGAIETKDLEHDFRLERKRLIKEDKKAGTSNNQIDRLYRRMQAGGNVIVLVHHTTTNLWRLVPLEWLYARQEAPSWDLREFQTYESAKRALMFLSVELGGGNGGE